MSGDSIPAIAHIRRNADGIVRLYSLDSMGGYLSEFVWSEGNFSCDCNRAIFFDDDDETDEPCGHERYSVRIVAQDDGRELYSDDNWRRAPK